MSIRIDEQEVSQDGGRAVEQNTLRNVLRGREGGDYAMSRRAMGISKE